MKDLSNDRVSRKAVLFVTRTWGGLDRCSVGVQPAPSRSQVFFWPLLLFLTVGFKIHHIQMVHGVSWCYFSLCWAFCGIFVVCFCMDVLGHGWLPVRLLLIGCMFRCPSHSVLASNSWSRVNPQLKLSGNTLLKTNMTLENHQF